MLSHLRLLFFSSLLCLSLAHNRLISPTPWNPTPIKQLPCGGGISLTAPQAYWHVGSTATIEWLVVGDGNNTLHISIDPTGGTNFSQVIVQNTAAPNFGTNFYNFTVPDVICTGFNDTCSIQVLSGSGWVACTSVNIMPACDNCPPEKPANPTCTTALGLKFCTQFNNSKISLGAGFNAAALDLMVNESLYEYSYEMPTFLTNGTTADCQKYFKTYLCAMVFPTCDGKVSCREDCTDFTTSCGLESSHAGLYNCSSLPKCPTKPKYQQTVIFTGISITVVIVLAFVLNFIICKRVKAKYTPIQ